VPKEPWLGQLWVLWRQRSHGWANFGFYGAKGAMAGPTLGSMVPKEPWLGHLWRQSRLVLTHVLGRLNHFISLYRPITNFAWLKNTFVFVRLCSLYVTRRSHQGNLSNRPPKMLWTILFCSSIFLFLTLYNAKITRNLLHISKKNLISFWVDPFRSSAPGTLSRHKTL